MDELTELKRKAPRLSVCMMVKNEEKLLRQCLESIKDVASEIIIVDTGSTDRTMDIAREFGAKIYEHPWQKDFSLHRNQSISYATGDWILQIDADEELAQESRVELLKLILNAPEEINGYAVLIQDYFRDGRKNFVFNFPRVFRNGVGVRYIGIVHNQVDIPPKVEFSSVQLNHYGYDLDRKTMLRKYKRSVGLLRKMARENPEQAEAWYYLTNAYSQYHRHKKCVQAAQKTIEVARQKDDVPLMLVAIYFPYITSLVALQRLDEAEKIAMEALDVFPRYVDVYFCLTRIKYIQREFAEAIRYGEEYRSLVAWYKEDLKRLKTISMYTVESMPNVELWLSIAYAHEGDIERSQEYFYNASLNKDVGVKQLVETIHNFAALGKYQLAQHSVSQAMELQKDNAGVIAALTQELAVIDQFGWLPDIHREASLQPAAEESFHLQAFINWINGKKDKAKSWAERSVQGENAGLARLILLDIDRADGRESEIQLFIAGLQVIMEDGLLPDREEVGEGEDLLRLIDELEILKTLYEMHMTLVNGQPERVVDVLVKLAGLTGVHLPDEWSDIAQLAGILIDAAKYCDQHLMPDAGYFALQLAYHYFPHFPQLEAILYKRQIDRAKRDNGCNPFQRMAAKFLLRTALNADAIDKRRNKRTKISEPAFQDAAVTP